MKQILVILISVNFFCHINAQIKPDIYRTTNDKELKITLVGHASLMFEFDGQVIHVDPYSTVADYAKLPDADLILITHEHGDHFDKAAIDLVKKQNTVYYANSAAGKQISGANILNNGDKATFNHISIEAVPAYNIQHKRPDGQAYHPEGVGNGYVLTFDNLKVYVAGDTEDIPEMNLLAGKVDIAFLPLMIPFTMSDEMFINAATILKATYLYPCHFSEFSDGLLSKLEGINSKIIVKPMKNR